MYRHTHTHIYIYTYLYEYYISYEYLVIVLIPSNAALFCLFPQCFRGEVTAKPEYLATWPRVNWASELIGYEPWVNIGLGR